MIGLTAGKVAQLHALTTGNVASPFARHTGFASGAVLYRQG